MDGKKLFRKGRTIFFVSLYELFKFSIPIHLLTIALTKADAVGFAIIPSLHRNMKHNINSTDQVPHCPVANTAELAAKSIPIPATAATANATEKINLSAYGNDEQNMSQNSSSAKKLFHDLAVATVFSIENKNTRIPTKALQFVNYFKNDVLEPGMPITPGQLIAQGGYGNIFEGSASNQDLVIKQVRTDKGEKGLRGIRRELDASAALYGVVTEVLKLNEENLTYDILPGISTLVPVIGTATDGSLIQKKVQGKNLKDIVVGKLAPYESGYPNCLREAIKRLSFFFFGLNTIHASGLIHCDLKPENIMLENNPSEGYPVRIIDFGGLRTTGDTIGIHSSNGAPEYTEQTYAIRENKLQQEQLKEERDKIKKQISQLSSPEEIEQLEAKIQSMKERYDALAKLIAFEESLRNNIAHPSYDIYSATMVFLPTLFGRKGLRLANKLYCFHQKGPVKFHFLQMARDPSFNTVSYFLETLGELNQTMYNTTGKSYPQPVLDQFIQLITAMSSLDPNERPSAIDIAEILQSIVLSPCWEN